MDSDDISVSKKYRPNDFSNLISGLCNGINFKMAIFLFIIYILIHNDIFITRVLSQIDGTVGETGQCPTTKGTIILGTILIIIYIIMDELMRHKLL